MGHPCLIVILLHWQIAGKASSSEHSALLCGSALKLFFFLKILKILVKIIPSVSRWKPMALVSHFYPMMEISKKLVQTLRPGEFLAEYRDFITHSRHSKNWTLTEPYFWYLNLRIWLAKLQICQFPLPYAYQKVVISLTLQINIDPENNNQQIEDWSIASWSGRILYTKLVCRVICHHFFESIWKGVWGLHSSYSKNEGFNISATLGRSKI